VRVRCNTISSIGYDQSDAYAEGIYLGHGNAPFDTGSSHIIVSRNEITDVLADGIDVKAGVTDVLITANHIHDLDFSATSFGRAITLAADNRSFSDAGYRVEGNVIERISSARNDDAIGILIGHGDTVIRNNVVSDIEDAAIAAQRHGSRFGWGNPDERDVAIHNNTLWNCGSTCLLDRGSRAVIDARNNFASDPIEPGAPTAAADDFVGPLDRTSDAGGGPGTAFALADTSAAVDAGTTLTFVSDLLRVSRPQGATWDLGALERVAEASEPANPLVSA
ncbi:MAG: right-handed parallel beta-helix repeat-containing protein, partial [Actinomycetota bacterium]